MQIKWCAAMVLAAATMQQARELPVGSNDALLEFRIDPSAGYARYPMGHKPIPGQRYAGFGLSDPITPREMAAASDRLHASEEQRREFGRLYKTYREDDWKYRQEHAQPLWDRSALIAPDMGHTVSAALQFKELMADCERILPQVYAIEDRLMDGMQAVLADSQLPSFHHVRNIRVRQRAQVVGSIFPGFTLDLEDELIRLEQAGFDCTPADPEAFAASQLEYSDAIAQLTVEYAQVVRRNMGDATVLMSQATELFAQGEKTSEERNAIGERHDALNKKPTELAKRMYAAHCRYVDTCSTQLPPRTATALRDQFRRVVHAPFFPDPFNLDELLDALNTAASQASDRDALVMISEVYAATRDEIDRKIIAMHMDWAEETSLRQGFKWQPYERYCDLARALQQGRRDNMTRTLDLLEAQLHPEVWQQGAELVAKCRKRVQAFEEHVQAMATQHDAWPLPYE